MTNYENMEWRVRTFMYHNGTIHDLMDKNKKFNHYQHILECLIIKNGCDLKDCNSLIKNNKKLVSKAIQSSWKSLEFASNELKNDYKIALKAIKQNGNALQFVSNELKNNKEFILKAIKYGCCVKHINKHFITDRDIILRCVKSNGISIKELPIECTEDKEIVLRAIKSTGFALKYCPKFCLNVDVVFEAIGNCSSYIRNIPLNLFNESHQFAMIAFSLRLMYWHETNLLRYINNGNNVEYKNLYVQNKNNKNIDNKLLLYWHTQKELAIYKLMDTDKIKKQNDWLIKEITEYTFHPCRIHKLKKLRL
jgi:hypothetical protein